MSRKVLITSRSFGQVSDEPLNVLRENNITFDFKEKSELYSEQDFMDVIEKYDGLIIGADIFTAKAIEKAKNLKIICKHGVGVDNIDLDVAKKHNICVTNVPATNSDAVADLTFGLILDVARKISYTAGNVKNNKWGKIIGTDVCNKTIGIIGFGQIGKRVAKRAEGFNMNVLVYDPFINTAPEGYEWVKICSFEQVIKEADFLTIHVPLNEKTHNLIDDEQMSTMKKGSFIINASRGGIVNEEALYKYLKSGHIAGAGLDVVEKEPPIGNPLVGMDNVTIVSHIASYSREAINKVDMVCAKNVVKMFDNQQVDNRVV